MIERRREPAVYRRIADEIAARIRSGELQPGDQLPSADLVCRLYGVGMATANRAIQELKYDGLIETEPGRRSRVRAQPERQVIKVQRGSQWWTRPATDADREQMTLAEGERVIVLVHGARVTLYPADSTEFRTS